jgi:hypothetical protein
MNNVTRQLVAKKNLRKTQTPVIKLRFPSTLPMPVWMLVGLEILAIPLLAGLIKFEIACVP